MGNGYISTVRIGVLARDSTELQRWQQDALTDLLNLHGVTLELLIIDKRLESEKPPTIRQRGGTLWKAYFKHILDAQSVAYQPVNTAVLWTGVPLLVPNVYRVDQWSEHFSQKDIEEILRYKLDILVRFGFGILRGNILNAAKMGVWSYHLGDPVRYRGGPPCFWEVVERAPYTKCTLQRLTNRLDSGVVLNQVVVKTNFLSYVQQLDTVAFAGVRLLRDAVVAFREGNKIIWTMPECDSRAPIRHAPTNREFLRFAATVAMRRILAVCGKFTTHSDNSD